MPALGEDIGEARTARLAEKKRRGERARSAARSPVAFKELLVQGHPVDEERFIREVLLTARL